MSSLHFIHWLRVVAVAGVVLAYGASADGSLAKGGGTTATSYSTARTVNSWCSRC